MLPESVLKECSVLLSAFECFTTTGVFSALQFLSPCEPVEKFHKLPTKQNELQKLELMYYLMISSKDQQLPSRTTQYGTFHEPSRFLLQQFHSTKLLGIEEHWFRRFPKSEILTVGQWNRPIRPTLSCKLVPSLQIAISKFEIPSLLVGHNPMR